MIDHPALVISAILAVVSVPAFVIFMSACAAGKREDQARNQLSDGDCRTDRAEDVPNYHEGCNAA
jgi:uncharacterized membrane protein